MPRKARITAENFPHHVTQRGNYRQPVFEDDQDRKKYLDWIKEYSGKYNLRIWAYCLMNNHVHFVVVPLSPASLSKTFNQAHMRYSQYFNKKKGMNGHLWQGRFYSCCLDESHLFAAVRYVENNPVRANLVENAWDYLWSSASAHVSGKENANLSDDFPLLKMIPDWREFLTVKEDERVLSELKKNTQSGYPSGSNDFIRNLEVLTGVKIAKNPAGRPVKREINQK